MEMFIVLDEEQQKEFRQWARDNYEVGSDINSVWHPVVQEECKEMNEEVEKLEKLETEIGEQEKGEKEYRFTWRHEVYINASSDEEAQSSFENMDTNKLGVEVERGDIDSHEFVEKVSAECITDDYRELV